ncbi:hypothetical protein Tco_0083663 [Tanacetum coccineum]
MRTRSQSRNSNRQQQQVNPTFVEPFNLVEPIPVVTMDDTRTMAQLLEAPTVGYEDAIVVPEITADNFELKHGLLPSIKNKHSIGHDRKDPHAPHRSFTRSLLHSVDSATGGNFLIKCLCDCLRIIEIKSKVRNSRKKPVVAKVSSSSSTPGISPDVAELKDMVKALLLDKKNQNQALHSVNGEGNVMILVVGSGTLPSNTITNPKVDLKGITTRSGVAYQGPTIPTTSSPPKVVERETEVTKDTVLPTNNGSTKDVQPPVVQVQSQVPNSEPVVIPVSAPMPNLKPSIPYPSRRNDEKRREKANDQVEKFYKIFQDMSFEISLADALILMPKFASTLKALIGNKEKLSEMARTPLNEHCSAVILNKLPEKLRDPGKFLIPSAAYLVFVTQSQLLCLLRGRNFISEFSEEENKLEMAILKRNHSQSKVFPDHNSGNNLNQQALQRRFGIKLEMLKQEQSVSKSSFHPPTTSSGLPPTPRTHAYRCMMGPHCYRNQFRGSAPGNVGNTGAPESRKVDMLQLPRRRT